MMFNMSSTLPIEGGWICKKKDFIIILIRLTGQDFERGAELVPEGANIMIRFNSIKKWNEAASK